MADLEAEAVLTMITRPDRLSQDAAVFATIASSVRTCTSTDRIDGGATITIGTGQPCPQAAIWF